MTEIHAGYQGVFDGRLQPGDKPALIVVDVMKAYTDPHSPMFSASAAAALDPIAAVIRYVRHAGHPIVFTRVEYQQPNCIDGGLFVEKIPLLKELRPGSKWSQFAEESVAPQATPENANFHTDVEIIKQFPSAFFETSLARTLTIMGCDTVFVVGFSTSGCVRATVLDAMQLGFRPFVIRECVADRSPEAHRINLLDIQSKYGEVVSLEEAQRIYDGMNARNNP